MSEPTWRDPESEWRLVALAAFAPEHLPAITARVGPEDIGHPGLREIYEAVLDLVGSRTAIDGTTLPDRLRERGSFERIGSYPFLAEVMGYVNIGAPDDPIGLARVVYRHATIRRFEGALRSGLEALDRGHDPELTWAETVSAIDNLGDPSQEDQPVDNMSDMAMALMAELSTGDERGLAWPWPAMTEGTGRIMEGWMWAVSAFSGGGKSTLLRSLALGLAYDMGIPVSYFAIEESGKQVLGLMSCALMNVDYQRLALGHKLSESELDAIGEGVRLIYNTKKLTINERKGWAPHKLLAQARRYAREGLARVIIIDHAHLVDYPGRTDKDRSHHIGKLAEDLHTLAHLEGVSVIAAYQPRKPESTGDIYRPVHPDEIRDTSKIFNIVENTLSPYRPLVKWNSTLNTEALVTDPSTGKKKLHTVPKYAEGVRPAKNWTFVQPGKRRIGGFGGPAIELPFNHISGRIG